MTDRKMKIAVFGGTGALGSALSIKWAAKGYPIIIGSRSKEKAETTVCSIKEEYDLQSIEGSGLEDAAKQCDLAVLTVPYVSHETTLKIIREYIQGKILIDSTVPLQKESSRVLLPKKGSAAMEAQDILGPDVKVISALQNIGSHLISSNNPVDAEVLVSGNDEEAINTVIQLIKDLDLQSWHAGPLENSAAAEALTSVLIAINKKYKLKSSSIKITSN